MRIYELMRRRSAVKSRPSIGMSPSIRTAASTSTPDERWRDDWATNEYVIARMPETAIEAFAGVGNPFSQGALRPGERVVDLGSGGGFDCFVAAGQVGPEGRVVGVDMTDEMLERSRATATALGLGHVEFRKGIIEELPVENGWADAVISNGVINLCADKRRVFNEVVRVLRPGGRLQFADIATGKVVPEAAVRNIDLWTD